MVMLQGHIWKYLLLLVGLQAVCMQAEKTTRQ